MPPELKKYDLLCVGHVCHDLLDENYILGGSVAYASAFASSTKKTSAILTRYGKDFQYADFFIRHNIDLINSPSDSTTIFQNVYIGDNRWQYLRSRADNISGNQILKHARQSKVLLLCPVADEIDIDILDKLQNKIIGVTIQGWLRQWDAEGRVQPKSMEWDKLSKADFVFLSYEDLGHQKEIDLRLLDLGNTVIITNDQFGADIFHDNRVVSLPSWPTEVVDPTGAGDTFACAFLLHFVATKNQVDSAIYAHCAASLVIEQRGMDYTGMTLKIEERMAAYKKKYNY